MSGRRGLAQILVLWALVLLGTLAGGFALSMRIEAQAARNEIDGLRAYYQARTGISIATMLVSSFPDGGMAGVNIEGGEEDAAYRVKIMGEGGKIDINLVTEDDLFEILLKGGLSGRDAESLRDAIFDWKDQDDDPRPYGAEAADYARLREPLIPRNGKFTSVEELRYVMGVTQELYDRFLSRVFTVHSNTSRVNVSEASRIVLASLPGVSPEAVEEILAIREEKETVSLSDLSNLASRNLLTQKGHYMLANKTASKVYEITSTGMAGRVVHSVRCMVTVGGGGLGKKSAKMLRWVDLAAAYGEEL